MLLFKIDGRISMSPKPHKLSPIQFNFALEIFNLLDSNPRFLPCRCNTCWTAKKIYSTVVLFGRSYAHRNLRKKRTRQP
jgi:hypothetical protein